MPVFWRDKKQESDWRSMLRRYEEWRGKIYMSDLSGGDGDTSK